MEINDITSKIRGAIFEVSKTLGSGFLEKVYEADGVGFARRALRVISGQVGRILSASVCG